MILKWQQIFKGGRYKVFTEKINKIALRSNDDEKIQPIDSIETCAYGTKKYLICKRDKWTVII